MSAVALQSDQITKIGVGVIVGLVVVGILVGLVMTALISRVIILVIVVALGAYVWQQRQHIEHDISKNHCQLSATFFGIHVKAPQDVVTACEKKAS